MISLNGVMFSYDGKTAVIGGGFPGEDDSLDVSGGEGLSLTIKDGEFVAIMGANGSGKSTLARLLNGLLLPTSGTIQVDGMSAADKDKRPDVLSRVALVFQNPDDALVTSLVGDEVAFGPANLGIPLPEIQQRVIRSLSQVGLAGFEKRDASTLSGGQKQRVALAAALAMRPRVLVLDEPTAMLDPQSRRDVADVICELHAQGVTVLWITHDPAEALRASRLLVMEAGRLLADGKPQELLVQAGWLRQKGLPVPTEVQLCQSLVQRGVIKGEDLNPFDQQQLIQTLRVVASECCRDGAVGAGGRQPEGVSPVHSGCTLEGDAFAPVVLEASHASYSYGRGEAEVLRDVSFALRKGEVLGVVGTTGSGKSTLLRLLAGLSAPTQGMVTFGGIDLASRGGKRVIRGKVGLVLQYPEWQLFANSVAQEVAFGPKNRGWNAAFVAKRVKLALEWMGFDADEMGPLSPFALSGGQQRRVALAGVLAMDPDVLLFDEPAAGLDEGSRLRYYQLLEQLKAQGKAVVLVSHAMEDVARSCDHVMLLEQGSVAAQGTPREVFAQVETMRRCGLRLPYALELAQELGVQAYCPDVESLAEALSRGNRE